MSDWRGRRRARRGVPARERATRASCCTPIGAQVDKNVSSGRKEREESASWKEWAGCSDEFEAPTVSEISQFFSQFGIAGAELLP